MLQGNPIPVLLRPTRALPLRLYFELFKLRIGLVIGLTAIAGVAVTPGPTLPAWRVCALALAVTLAAAAAGAFNQMMERDLDAHMRRTRSRPFVTGRLRAGPAWLVAIAATGGAGIALAAVAINSIAAMYTFLGAFTYAVIYTIWLKRRSRWNIVVGGLAGSFAVLAGAAAVSPHTTEPLPLSFAFVLFLWTPPHFWSLAIAFRDDYAAAKVPMLPVVIGNARAARSVFGCAALLVLASLMPVLLGMGRVYLATVIGAGAYLLLKSAQLAHAPSYRTAMANFHASLTYLTLLIGAAIAEVSLKF